MQSVKLFSCCVRRMILVRSSLHHVGKTTSVRGQRSWSRLRFEKMNTLQNWFIRQIELSFKYNREKELLNTEGNFFPSSGANASLIISRVESLENTEDPRKFHYQLNSIDKESCAALKSLSKDEIFAVLNKLAAVAPHRVISMKFYSTAIEELRIALRSGLLNAPHKIVNLIFLMGLRKKAGARDLDSSLKHVLDFGRLSLVQQAIVSTAAFKCGVKLDRVKIRAIEYTTCANIEALITEPRLFVSLLKVLRHGGPSVDFSLHPITRAILRTEESLRISLAVPLLALYAEMFDSEKKIVDRLIDDSLRDISRAENTTPNEIRIKDVDRLLWAASRLDHKLNDDQLIEVEKFVDRKLDQLIAKPGTFCGMILSLWMMGFKCLRMIQFCFDKEIFHSLIYSSPKNRARISLLLDCLKLESPDVKIPPVLNVEPETSKKIKPCQELITVRELLKCMAKQLAVSQTEIDCPIKSLRIYGITTKHTTLGWIHIDVLNSVTCLRNSKTPHGLMALKLRLVEATGYNSIMLDHGGLIRMEETVATIEKCVESLLRTKNVKQ